MFNKIMSFICVGLLCLFSFLSVVPKDNSFVEDDVIVGVSKQDVVDGSYVYSSSNFPLAGLYSSSQIFPSFSMNTYIPFGFVFSSSSLDFSCYFYDTRTGSYGLGSRSFSAPVYDKKEYFFIPFYDTDSENYTSWVFCSYLIQTGFNFNVYSFEITSADDFRTIFGVNISKYAQHIIFYDSDGRTLDFSTAYTGNQVPGIQPLGDRRYYLSNSLTDNQFYESGYNYGYSAGLGAGSSSGYNDGYSAGNSVGYQNGYNQGAADANNYSFLGLIGAVFDAPVNTFVGLLNFDLLGFNMLKALTGLITLAIIITFIRLVMGRK